MTRSYNEDRNRQIVELSKKMSPKDIAPLFNTSAANIRKIISLEKKRIHNNSHKFTHT